MAMPAARANKRTLQKRFRKFCRYICLDGYYYPRSSQLRTWEKRCAQKDIEEGLLETDMELDETTYPISKKAVENLPKLIEQQTKTMQDLGFSQEEIERCLEPTRAFMAGVEEDVKLYEEKLSRGSSVGRAED